MKSYYSYCFLRLDKFHKVFVQHMKTLSYEDKKKEELLLTEYVNYAVLLRPCQGFLIILVQANLSNCSTGYWKKLRFH